MNKVLLLSTLLFTTLFGSNILSYNIYDRTDRVDIMLTFDTPYEGKIVKSTKKHKIILRLYDAKIESVKKKSIQSKFIDSIIISPHDGYTQIEASLPSQKITLKASKTADAYGLRLRFKEYTPPKPQFSLPTKSTQPQTTQTNLPTQKELEIPTSYYVVVGILFAIVIILFVFKRKLSALDPKEVAKSSWLFSNKKQKAPLSTPKAASQPTSTTASNDVTIRFQKQLNENTSVIMLDFLNQSYLLLLGTNNNILLDKFIDNQPTTQNEFEALLAQKNDELEQYLQLGHQEEELPSSQDEIKEFSQKASHIPFNL